MVTCWGNKSILQSSKNAASDPGSKMSHPWYRRDTVADSLDRASERLQATEQRQHLASAGVAGIQERMTSAI